MCQVSNIKGMTPKLNTNEEQIPTMCLIKEQFTTVCSSKDQSPEMCSKVLCVDHQKKNESQLSIYVSSRKSEVFSEFDTSEEQISTECVSKGQDKNCQSSQCEHIQQVEPAMTKSSHMWLVKPGMPQLNHMQSVKVVKF